MGIAANKDVWFHRYLHACTKGRKQPTGAGNQGGWGVHLVVDGDLRVREVPQPRVQVVDEQAAELAAHPRQPGSLAVALPARLPLMSCDKI